MKEPCAKCPWFSGAERDIKLITEQRMEAAALVGTWFCCHVNLGTCWGAVKWREEQQKKKKKAA